MAGRAVDSPIILPAGSPLSTAPGQRAEVFLPSSQPCPSLQCLLHSEPLATSLSGWRGWLAAPLDEAAEQSQQLPEARLPDCQTGMGLDPLAAPSAHTCPASGTAWEQGQESWHHRAGIWLCSSSGQSERGRRAGQQPQQP